MLSTALTERYDSNVMLQNEGAQAHQESFVTSVLPVVGGKLQGQGDTDYSVALRYAPDFTFFTDLSRESYLRQIGIFDFDVSHGGFSADGSVKAQYTDGTTEPPTWGTTANGDQVPALGACEVRSRRRNMYFSSKLVGSQTLGRVSVQGVFDARIWDFMTDDTFVSGLVIQNYYDRSDMNGGVDLGLQIYSRATAYLGYRLGHQNQEFRADQPSYSFANDYHRFFVGLRSSPVTWLTFSGEIGPSLHYFDAETIPAGTHTEQTYLYFLVGATIRLGANTTFKALAGQYLLPAAAGNGVFQNLTASGTLDHQFSPKWRGSLAFAFTEYDFDATFLRRDQMFIPEARLEYTFNTHLSAVVWYAFEWTANLIDQPNFWKREYDRQTVGIGIKASY